MNYFFLPQISQMLIPHFLSPSSANLRENLLATDAAFDYLRAFMESSEPKPDSEALLTLVRMKMPFGKYKDVLLCDLPVSYLEWFAKKGFPPGKLGMLLATVYEIKINGLMYLLDPLKQKHP